MPAIPKASAPMISLVAANHENAVTPVPCAPGKASLNELQCGSRWTAVIPSASGKPMAIAISGAHRQRRNTAATPLSWRIAATEPATSTSAVTMPVPRRMWSPVWMAHTRAYAAAAHRSALAAPSCVTHAAVGLNKVWPWPVMPSCRNP